MDHGFSNHAGKSAQSAGEGLNPKAALSTPSLQDGRRLSQIIQSMFGVIKGNIDVRRRTTFYIGEFQFCGCVLVVESCFQVWGGFWLFELDLGAQRLAISL
jgi:hypothetical protein